MDKRRTVLILLALFIILVMPDRAYASESHYILGKDHKRIPIPLSYEVTNVIMDFGDEVGPIKNAQYLFMDQNETLYIVDTENSRVLKTNKEGTVLGVYTGPEDFPFYLPEGIFVDEDGDMYVADTGNNRIVHLAPDGTYVEQFEKPQSALMDAHIPFAVSKLAIDKTGYIYALIKDDYHGFTIMDSYNRFRSYMASVRLPFDLVQWFTRNFATSQQKSQISKDLPPSYSNFVFSEDGMIYATTVGVPSEQIKKLNSVGKDIYKFSRKDIQQPDPFFGEHVDDLGRAIKPVFTDLAVDQNGIISAVDSTSQRIYQYDQEGNLLTVFGGFGRKKGTFRSPISIVGDKEGNLYVLDYIMNNIQVFKPTKFITHVHQAISLYNDGKYQEAVNPWQEVLKIDANYELAHRGIAKALMKQERWKEAMEEYRKGEDQYGYSKAFAEYRHQVFRDYFGWIVLAVSSACLLIIRMVGTLKRVIRTDRKFKSQKVGS